MTSNARVARLTALALATGTLVAAGAGTASAASKTTTDFVATGGGSVLSLTVNLPVAVPGIGQTLHQDLVITGSNARTADVKAISQSVLGANGNISLVQGLLQQQVTAEFGKPKPPEQNAFPDLSALGITGKLLALKSEANSPLVDGTVAHSLSEVADLRVGDASNLQAVLDQLSAQLTAVFQGLLGTAGQSQHNTPVADVTPVVQNLLTQVISTVNTTTQGQAKQVTDAVQNVVNQLDNLPQLLSGILSNTLKTTLSAAAKDPSLLHVGLIQSEQTVTRNAGVVTSASTQKLTGISALGGLVEVKALSSGAVATLGNGISKAVPSADETGNLLEVNVENVLKAKLGSGLGIDLTSNLLPANVVKTVQDAVNQVTGLLNSVLGATLTQAKANKVATADRAMAETSVASFVVDPALPGVGHLFPKPILELALVPSKAEVVRAQSVTPPAIVTPSKATSQPVMASTGANFALTAPIAVGLMGLAAVARRRRLSHLG